MRQVKSTALSKETTKRPLAQIEQHPFFSRPLDTEVHLFKVRVQMFYYLSHYLNSH
ncbi:MAG: hypothetical protein MJE68_33015 [Proteobacteria bacterium]|nr:hypothetical protein [Pseudomonadota bacterium]